MTEWRQTTIEELKSYYYNEFPDQWFSMIPNFISESQPKEVGVAFRDGYPIQKDKAPPRDFIRRSTFDGRSSQGNVDPLSSWDDLLAFFQNPAGRDPITSDHQLVDPALTDEASIPDAVYASVFS